jgi:hypothetical protein
MRFAGALLLLLSGAACTRTNAFYAGIEVPTPDLAVEYAELPDLAGFDLTGVDLQRVPIQHDLSAPPPLDFAGVDLTGVDLTALPSPDLAPAPDLKPFVGCGDGICMGGESCATCQVDCGGCNSCPAGFADCDTNPSNGCETDIRTAAHCGGCSNTCAAAGGTNACVPLGDTYVCQPSCDNAHKDCDGNTSNGCETNLSLNATCGACNNPCGDSATCVNVSPGVFACNTSCDATHVDCDGNTTNGCETRIDDSNETANNTCAGQVGIGDINEGIVGTLSFNRISPGTDVDVFQAHFIEAAHSGCSFLSTQTYTVYAQVVAPAGQTLAVFRGPTSGMCDNTWSPSTPTSCITFTWNGTCGFTDQPYFSFKVSSPTGTSACLPYSLAIGYCTLGTNCVPAGCTTIF